MSLSHNKVLSFWQVCLGGLLLAGFKPAEAANQPPFVTLVSPIPGTLLSEGDSIKLQANTSDPDGTVLKVEFYVDGDLLGETAPAPFTLWWSNVVVGTHGLAAVAVDDALERATSAVVTVTVSAPAARALFWSPSSTVGTEWNGTALNWRTGGRPTVFHPGDSVTFSYPGTAQLGPVFIGTDGTPMPVSPAAVTIQTSYTFFGGDILTGSLTNFSSSSTLFSNYSGSLSFPGGTTFQPATSGGLTYDVSSAPNGASVHFGTGPIALNGIFAFQMASNRWATLENGFAVSNLGGTISVNPMNRPNVVARFSGPLNLGGPLIMGLGNPAFLGSGSDATPHEWSGPVMLDQSPSARNLRLFVSGSYTAKGLLLGGNITDGLGEGTNRLRLANYAAPSIRLTAPNTYQHGTLIENSLSAPRGVIEVGPHSSLGVGDVEVESGGVLRLMGSGNIASNASVIVRGQVILDSGVKVRLSSLKLGGNIFTSGLFTATNSPGYLASNGTFRLPATNLPPSVSLTNPVDGVSFVAGESIAMQAAVADLDGYIARVEFRVNGTLFGVRTNAPFQLSLRNAPGGAYPLQVVAYDDEGAPSASSVVNVSVAPRIDLIETVDTNIAVLEFKSLLNQNCVLQATDTLSPVGWTNLASFPGGAMASRLRITNALPDGVNTRFYRLVLP